MVIKQLWALDERPGDLFEKWLLKRATTANRLSSKGTAARCAVAL